MQKTIHELVDQIESVIAKYSPTLSEDIIAKSEDEVKEICTKLSISNLKELEDLYPCVNYLLFPFTLLPVKEICVYHEIWQDDIHEFGMKELSIHLVESLIFAVEGKDLYYIVSKEGQVQFVSFLGQTIDTLAKDLRSFLNAFADTLIYLEDNGLYDNHIGISPSDPIFRQKLREHSPDLYTSILAELENLKSDPNLTEDRLFQFGYLLLSAESAQDFFLIAENLSLDSKVRKLAQSMGEDLLKLEEK